MSAFLNDPPFFEDVVLKSLPYFLPNHADLFKIFPWNRESLGAYCIYHSNGYNIPVKR